MTTSRPQEGLSQLNASVRCPRTVGPRIPYRHMQRLAARGGKQTDLTLKHWGQTCNLERISKLARRFPMMPHGIAPRSRRPPASPSGVAVTQTKEHRRRLRAFPIRHQPGIAGIPIYPSLAPRLKISGRPKFRSRVLKLEIPPRPRRVNNRKRDLATSCYVAVGPPNHHSYEFAGTQGCLPTQAPPMQRLEADDARPPRLDPGSAAQTVQAANKRRKPRRIWSHRAASAATPRRALAQNLTYHRAGVVREIAHCQRPCIALLGNTPRA